MSLSHAELIQDVAIYVLKTALSNQKTTNSAALSVDISDANSTVAADLTAMFAAAKHKFDEFRNEIQQAADELLTAVRTETGVGDGEIMATMRSTPSVLPIFNRVKGITKASLGNTLQAFVPVDTPASADGEAATQATPDGEDETGYTPVLIPQLDLTTLGALDRTVYSGTNKAFNTVAQIVGKLEEAQRYIAQRRFSSPIVRHENFDALGEFPRGRCIMTQASSLFADCLPTSELSRFAFEIPTYKWESRHPKVPPVAASYQYDPEALYLMLWAISRGKNAVLVGPTGCGKTTVTEQLAARLGRPHYRIPVDGEMRKREMIGGFKQVATENGSQTVWFDGLLTQAIRMPAIIDIDEMDRADPDLQYVAHQAYERKGLTILEDEGRFIPPHEHHSIMATANTRGRDDGENPYQLQHQMSEATRDRFTFWIDCTYMADTQELTQVTIDAPGIDPSSAKRLIKYAGLMRASFIDNRLSTTCSYRQLLTCAEFAITKSKDPADQMTAEMMAIKSILLNRVPLKADTAAMLEFGKQIYGDKWKV